VGVFAKQREIGRNMDRETKKLKSKEPGKKSRGRGQGDFRNWGNRQGPFKNKRKEKDRGSGWERKKKIRKEDQTEESTKNKAWKKTKQGRTATVEKKDNEPRVER